MIIQCDNRECIEWIKKAESIFENMGIDLSKIGISISILNNELLKRATGVCKDGFDGIFFIYIRNDLQFDCFIQTYAHEVGHATQNFGYSNHNNFITGVITESIALEFEKEFLMKFNKRYDTNISVNADFNGFNKYGLAYYVKNFVILSTKSEYKLIKK